jgi:hypothetical protein
MRKQQCRETDRVWLGEWRCLSSIGRADRCCQHSAVPSPSLHSTPSQRSSRGERKPWRGRYTCSTARCQARRLAEMSGQEKDRGEEGVALAVKRGASMGGERCTVRGVSCRPVLQEGDKLSRASAVCRCRRQPHAGACRRPCCALALLSPFPFPFQRFSPCWLFRSSACRRRAHTHTCAQLRDRGRFSFSSRSNLSCAAVKIVDVVGLPCAAASLCCVVRVLPCLRRLRQLSLCAIPQLPDPHLPCAALGRELPSSASVMDRLTCQSNVRVSRCRALPVAVERTEEWCA